MPVSVALTTHNGSRYIAEQLRSLLDQTLPPSEFIISDDASEDGTLDVIAEVFQKWRADHGRAGFVLRVLRNSPPLGVTANFEQALGACTNDLIALCDQDDIWHRSKLEQMVVEFERRPDLMLLHSDARMVDREGSPTGETLFKTLYVSSDEISAVHAGHAVDVLLRRNIVTGATAVLRRELVHRSRPFPASWVHDEWLSAIGAVTGAVDLLELQLIDYRQHGGNQIGASRLNAAGKLRRLCAPRTERNRRLLTRATSLYERAARLTPAPPAETLRKISEKVSHERMRSELPRGRIRRIRPIIQEWRSGAYSKYGLGIPDVLRDLVQPD
jgi:glycosyltransferase involved in cell wall biosynthesis